MSYEEDSRTLWCGNLSEKISYEVLYELFYQAGPLEKLRIPRDREGRQRNFAFITYVHCETCPYAIELFRGTELFNRKISLKWQNNSAGSGQFAPSRDVAMLLNRPYLNGSPPVESEYEHASGGRFLAEGDQLESFDRCQMRAPPNGISVSSLQGQWTSRHASQREGRRYEPYRRTQPRQDRRDDSGERGRSDRDSIHAENLRRRLERFSRTESIDYERDCYQGTHNGRSHSRRNRDSPTM